MVSSIHSSLADAAVMVRSGKGYVLLIVLVYLQLMAGLIMIGLVQTGLMMSAVQDEFDSNQRLSSALHVLHNLEISLTSHVDCRLPVQRVDELTVRPDSWWQTQGCHFALNGMRYEFIWEKLLDDVCGRVSMRNDVEVSVAQYIRLTLHSSPSARQGAILLQSTLVRPVRGNGNCDGRWHEVKSGYQSVRYLTQKEYGYGRSNT